MKAEDLVEGEVYYSNYNKENVEFRYIGSTGLAIVCEPGDSGGGMQSCWALDVKGLENRIVFSKEQLRYMIRPMFASTIQFGYATEEQVEKALDDIFGK